MKRIADLFWDDISENHLVAAHDVKKIEVEDVLLGIDGEPPRYRIRRDGDYYAVYGETGGGRLLLIVGEFVIDGRFRPFAARDMEPNERRYYRKGK